MVVRYSLHKFPMVNFSFSKPIGLDSAFHADNALISVISIMDSKKRKKGKNKLKEKQKIIKIKLSSFPCARKFN